MRTKTLLTVFFTLSFAFNSCGQSEKISTSLKTENDSISYAFGVSLGYNLHMNLGMEEINAHAFAMALQEIFAGDTPVLDAQEANMMINDYLTKQQFGENLEEGKKFLAENKLKVGITTTESGIQYEVITMGSGPKPAVDDEVVVHYTGTIIDGTVFDSSVERGEPAQFRLDRVIPGWTEALQLMPVGSKWKIYIPQELAYGANPRQGGMIEPYMMLIFEVELLDIVE
jgi:FKBP-type peptidyl-prolyl cis-trans isomerase